jgi:hypothetical protein
MGGGLMPPAAGGQAAAPPGPGAQSTYTREQTLDGADVLTADATQIVFPTVGGFGLAINLASPTPPGMTPSPAASGVKTASIKAKGGTAPPAASASPIPTPSVSPSASPSAGASGSPSPSPAGSGSPAASASAVATHKPSPGPKPKVTTKTTIYPNDAPPAPTPEPTGNVQTFFHQAPIVRAFFESPVDLTLSSVGAAQFTIPKVEQTPKRGFVVAFFEAGKKSKDTLLAWSGSVTLANDVVSATGAEDPVVLKKNVGYVVVLYGDALPPTPPPAGSYPAPGYNPVPTPAPSGYGAPPYAAPPYGGPGATYPPGYQPTYAPGYPTPTPTPVLIPH